MLNVRFMKAPPTTYVLHFVNGRVRREGPGLSFFYWAPGATIVVVPVGSADAPFAFQEATADFQVVAIQGQVTYRVRDPKRLAELLDLSLGPNGRYRTDDYQKLPERIVHATQMLVRAETQRLTLAAALTDAAGLGARVLAGLRAADAIVQLGVEVLGLSVLAVRPAPESAKALEAEAREALQRRADEAIYARRNAAVEQERRIKESELQTEIALEEQRARLLDERVANDRKEAESRAFALETTLAPVRGLDWRTLMALRGGDPGATIALAFQELAANAGRIGEVNVSPDLLRALLPSGTGKTEGRR
ncbi:MAG TPA: SPFH domain-containing protein [Methylomirabilota bacterium]|nr:SPFH domain-containing protein [Methylomirabilota bacterium]